MKARQSFWLSLLPLVKSQCCFPTTNHSDSLSGTFMLKHLIPFLIVLLPLTYANAQWQSVAPNLIGTGPYNNSGAMGYADGVAWAGLYDLYKSTDKGMTWQEVTIPNAGSNTILGVTFYDRNTGIVCGSQGIYVTHDQGQTWKTFFSGQSSFNAAFSGSSNAYVVGSVPSGASFTSDDGLTWHSTVLGRVSKDFVSVTPGTAIAFIETPTDSHVAITTDYGVTWNVQTGKMECDSHSFAVLECDQSVIFGINEEGGNYAQDNNLSEIYLSTDGGASFASIKQSSLGTLSGCIAITPGAIYVPAHTTGIFESTDVGKTWTTIAGPNVPIDSRDLITIDDTIMLAADIQGTIWRTVRPENVGSGSSVISHVQVMQQFHADTTAPCQRMPSKVYFYTVSCANRHATLDSASLSGSHAFTLDGTSASRELGAVDSLLVYYDPATGGIDTAQLKLSYTLNGSRIDTVIQLINSGFTAYSGTSYSDGKLNTKANVQLSIPVSVAIEKSVNIQARRVYDITYQLAFDASVLNLPGSTIIPLITAPTGWTVLNAASSGGTVTVTLQNLQGAILSDSLYLGILDFTTGSVSPKSTLITTSSVTLTTDSGIIALCFFNEGDFIANVAVGVAGVSRITPANMQLTLNPNPLIRNSTLHLQWDAIFGHSPEIEIFDVLGKSVERHTLGTASQGAFDLSLSPILPSGTYYLRFSDDNYVESRTFELLP
jgi:photosystem II stability/assembly factor-like uncharacterized protein